MKHAVANGIGHRGVGVEDITAERETRRGGGGLGIDEGDLVVELALTHE